MSYKAGIGVAFAALCIGGVAVAEPSKDMRARVIEYFQHVGLLESVNAQVEAQRTNLRTTHDDLPETFWENEQTVGLFEKYKQQLVENYADVVIEEVSAEELDFLVRFYGSEEGQRSIVIARRVQPSLAGAGAAANAAFEVAFSNWIDDYAK